MPPAQVHAENSMKKSKAGETSVCPGLVVF